MVGESAEIHVVSENLPLSPMSFLNYLYAAQPSILGLLKSTNFLAMLVVKLE